MKQNFLLLLFVLCFSKNYSQEMFEVFFDFNKDILNDKSTYEFKDWLSSNKNIEILKLHGFCDSIDDNNYNADLAMRRINSIQDILKSNQIKLSENIELKPFGKDFKLSKKQEENRKVIVYYKVLNTSNKQIEINATSEAEYDSIVEKERSALANKFYKAKKGDIIKIQNLNFYLNSEKIYEKSEPLLLELYQILIDNPKLRIEIHGHICCNQNPMDTKLSYRRAIVILKYLTNKGIQVNRMNFKGYGSNDPIYRLPERNEFERAANRRVEIVIIEPIK